MGADTSIVKKKMLKKSNDTATEEKTGKQEMEKLCRNHWTSTGCVVA